jgi:thiol-disulfide isomerase/thioredoxin
MKTVLTMVAAVLLATGMIGTSSAQDYGTTEHKNMRSDMAMEHAAHHGKYASYNKAAFDNAKDVKRVVFFAATWCPTCMATDKALKQSKANIPAGVEIFKADFDKSGTLKEKYGVTHMDTFVQVDKDGQKIALWNGGGVDGIAKNLK